MRQTEIRALMEQQFCREMGITRQHLRENRHIFCRKKADVTFRHWGQGKGDILCYAGKLLVRMEDEAALHALRDRFIQDEPQWFFTMDSLTDLRSILATHGLKMVNMAPFFVPDTVFAPEKENEAFVYHGPETVRRFLDAHPQLSYAFSYDAGEKGDKAALAYYDAGQLVAACGASWMAPTMWEMGVQKVVSGAKYQGIASQLVRRMVANIMQEHPAILPVYGTQFSHTQSMNTALRAGLIIGWTEIMIDAAE